MSYLIHHGIKGQKWGVHRYQNKDGTYTELGKWRRRVGPSNFLTQNGGRCGCCKNSSDTYRPI